jgi:hypothetical protein
MNQPQQVGTIFFQDEDGDHRIPQDGNLWQCDFCLKTFFIPHTMAKAIFGPGGRGGYCSDTCADWMKGIRSGEVDPTKDVPPGGI